jgi:hypothetical protein
MREEPQGVMLVAGVLVAVGLIPVSVEPFVEPDVLLEPEVPLDPDPVELVPVVSELVFFLFLWCFLLETSVPDWFSRPF